MRGERDSAAGGPNAAAVIAPSQPTRNAPATDRVSPIAPAAQAAPAKSGGISRGTVLLVAGLVLAVAAAVVAVLLFVVH